MRAAGRRSSLQQQRRRGYSPSSASRWRRRPGPAAAAPSPSTPATRRPLAGWRAPTSRRGRRRLTRGLKRSSSTQAAARAFIRDYRDLLSEDPEWRDRAARILGGRRRSGPGARRHTAPGRAGARLDRASRFTTPAPCATGSSLEARSPRCSPTSATIPSPWPSLTCAADRQAPIRSFSRGSLKSFADGGLRALEAGAPETIYTANIGCWMHLKGGTRTPVRHWIEAVEAVL